MESLKMNSVDAVVRDLLDGMRNAYLHMAIGEPHRAIECVNDVEKAHLRLSGLLQGDPANEALAGRILFQAIRQSIESLRILAKDYIGSPMSSSAIVEFVARSVNPARADD